MGDYTIDFRDGTAHCGTCGREFQMHHLLREPRRRRQLGRTWVCNINNIRRHVIACQKRESSKPAQEG